MTRQALPKSVALEVSAAEYTPGLVGLVEAVGAAMAHQGAAVDVAELVTISSAAFSNYVFEPLFNQHEEEPRAFSELGEMFSNYGPWGAISQYTGWQVREVSDLPPAELIKLAAFELSQGRPFVTLDEALAPTLVSGYEVGIATKRLTDVAGRTWDLEAETLQGESEVFSNWLLLVRPGEREEWMRSTARQRVDVLRWAAEHGRNGKEFFQETRENYAPGLLGIARFRAFLEGLTDPEGVAFAERYVARLGRARDIAATVLPTWIDSVADEVETDAVRPDLEEAARQFRKSQLALASRDTLVDAFASVEVSEGEALKALERAAAHFPRPFEA